jgi:hypothetical protein
MGKTISTEMLVTAYESTGYNLRDHSFVRLIRFSEHIIWKSVIDELRSVHHVRYGSCDQLQGIDFFLQQLAAI